jgi:hypothetical protein
LGINCNCRMNKLMIDAIQELSQRRLRRPLYTSISRRELNKAAGLFSISDDESGNTKQHLAYISVLITGYRNLRSAIAPRHDIGSKLVKEVGR